MLPVFTKQRGIFRFALLLVLAALSANTSTFAANAPRSLLVAPIPFEVSSTHFTVEIDGQRSPVVHAAAAYFLLNFRWEGPAHITVTADDPHYWDKGVEIQPMRFGIRPSRDRGSITFTLDEPAKLSIIRPGEHFGDSEMLFLFGNEPEPEAPHGVRHGVRYFGPGVHRENIDAHSGDQIFLADGAVVFGALNIWQVHDVHVFGGGMLIYDGPQDPDHDTGWMHKRNWHAIVMDKAANVRIDGITAVVRSRTWMIQMRDTRGVVFHNVKVIGGSTGNANQDGMDWLGGGDALVQDCFLRAADDIFAMYGNWDGYTEAALRAPGHDVGNIIVERSVLSTSISNVVRANWPRKNFNSHHFTMRNSDVLHMGFGSCGVPFALLEIWANPDGKGNQNDYRFEDVRLEDWYSLTQLQQDNAGIRNVTFSRISALDGPALVPSTLMGDVGGVVFQSVVTGGAEARSNEDIPVEVSGGAKEPTFDVNGGNPGFTYTSGLLKPGNPVVFEAHAPAGAHVRWLFGDGSAAEGAVVRHAYPDTDGTLLDGSGRFRVLLASTDESGHTVWISQQIVIAPTALPAQTGLPQTIDPGLVLQGDGARHAQGLLDVPADGGYTFTLLTSTAAKLRIDGVEAISPTLRPQVCGSPGYAVQPVRLSVALSAGWHRIRIDRGTEPENARSQAVAGTTANLPMILWQGPGIDPQAIPLSALGHTRTEN